MKTRLFVISLLPALLVILVFGLTGGVTAQGNQSTEKPEMKLSTDLTLVSISPASFANGVNMPVTIIGSNLDTVISATLGTTPLRNLEIVSSTQVTALVPWSIITGTHDLTVKGQGVPDAILPNAVTISAGSTDWTSNGPYGGDLYNVVLDPVDSSRMYVSAGRSGLWRSQNGGASWDFSLVTPFPHRVQIAYPTPGQPPVMYMRRTGGGLHRSLDYGQTWEDKTLSDIDGAIDAFVRPGHPNWVYLAVNNDDPPLGGGLYKSTNLGESWAIVTGTSGLQVNTVAFDPDHPDLKMVIGTATGQVYTTTDDGVTWSNPVTLTNKIGQLYFTPTLYNGKRSLFALPCSYELDCDNNGDTSYQSTDGGRTWNPLHVAPTQNNNNGLVFELAFHDSIPGLMWAAVGDGYYSEDGGATWYPVGAGIHKVQSFAVVPGAASRQTTTLFAATQGHLYKSTNGGDTWQEADTGLGAELVRTIAISPFNADEAYIATHEQGVLHTFDGGRSWQSLPIPIDDYGTAIVTDPFTDGKVFFGDDAYSGLTPTVRVSNDHGSAFTEHVLTLPAYTGQWANVSAIAPDPQTPNRLLVGVCLAGVWPAPGPGFIYTSIDGGLTWTQQTTPADAKCISRLAFDPNDPDVVYAGSTGYGLLRSTDGGANWAPLANQPTTGAFMSIEIDPSDSNSIYLAVFARDPVPGGIIATHNGGETWVKMTGVNVNAIWALKLVRVGEDYWLYAATMGGLRYLRTIPDDPTTPWESASGIAGVATVDGFNAATEEGRVVYYVGTSGGTVPTSSGASRGLAAAAGSQNMAGGIYRRATPPESPFTPPPGWQRMGLLGGGISALEVFNGQLYAGYSNWASDNGARVWRLNNDNHWTPVSQVGMSSTYSTTNPAIPDLVTFKGQLYASVGWGANEGQIWRTSNGTDWTKVTGSEFGGVSNRWVSVMTVFSDTLYVGADAGTAEIWRSSTGNSGSWGRVAQDGLGNPNNNGMTGAATFNGFLYVALGNTVDGISVWRTANGTDWTQVNTSGFGDVGNSESGGMAALGGYLYAGMKNTTTGGQIWRFDGTNWSQVMADGFGNVNNSKIASLYTVGNWLFAVTQNSVTGVQVWRTTNGTNWTALNLNGFGNSNNNDVLWSNSSTAFENTFFVGTWNGEIWQYVGFPVYLPLVMR